MTSIRLDASNTRVTFALGATFHTVHGTARVSRGEITFDSQTAAISGQVVIDARSADTQNEKRDAEMRDEVLETGKYPDIVLTAHRVEGRFNPSGESDVRVAGSMEIHGGRHDVVVPVHLRAGAGKLAASARFTIPYVAWGMKDPSVAFLRVKKEVEVTFDFEGPVTQSP